MMPQMNRTLMGGIMLSRIQTIKILVVVIFTVVGLTLFVFDSRMINVSHASISGPPASRTGAPGEMTCTDCHNQNAGTGQFTITAPASYTPGQTYQIQVRHVTTDSTRRRWGFELTALSNNTMAGTFANLNANTRITTGNSRSYIEHTSAGTFQNQTGGATWSFNWTAPATNIGPVTLYAAGIQANNNGSESGDQTYTTNAVIQPAPTVVIRHHVRSDFDGDGKSDVAVYRPSTGEWYASRSSNGALMALPFGVPTDIATPGDFDGDDKMDVAVWRSGPAGTAAFYILQSSTGTVRTELFGQTGDNTIAVGDWDGDGKADPAVYRDSAVGQQSYFFYRGSLNNPAGNTTYIPWGVTGDKPMYGDFDGDGRMDPAIFRPSDQTWYIYQSSNGSLRADRWGVATDRFISGDFDGDAKTDLTVFRGGIWYVKQSSNGQGSYINWGLASDAPFTGDYDSDGKSDVGVYRGGIWYIRVSATGSLDVRSFGVATDTAVASVNTQ